MEVASVEYGQAEFLKCIFYNFCQLYFSRNGAFEMSNLLILIYV